mgnify:CR=1 FL=1
MLWTIDYRSFSDALMQAELWGPDDKDPLHNEYRRRLRKETIMKGIQDDKA